MWIYDTPILIYDTGSWCHIGETYVNITYVNISHIWWNLCEHMTHSYHSFAHRFHIFPHFSPHRFHIFFNKWYHCVIWPVMSHRHDSFTCEWVMSCDPYDSCHMTYICLWLITGHMTWLIDDNTLQHTVMSHRQHTATHCNTLQRTATNCNTHL